MERDVYFLIDSSGSFNECGKNYLQIYLVDSIVNALESNSIKINGNRGFFLWSNNISEYTPGDSIKFKGKADFDTLSEFFSRLKENSIVFLLSDGNFNYDPVAMMQDLKMKNINIVPFSVGADSDVCNLEQLSTSMKVYKAENLISSINSVLLESEL